MPHQIKSNVFVQRFSQCTLFQSRFTANHDVNVCDIFMPW